MKKARSTRFDCEARRAKHEARKDLNFKFRVLNTFRILPKGFTMLETLVAISVFTLASIIVFIFVRQGYQVQRFSFEGERAVSSSQRGIETMIKELREVVPSSVGAYPIEKADYDEIIFFADFDRDNAVERVRYYIEGTKLKKGVIEPTTNPISYPTSNEITTVIAEGVRNGELNMHTFKYFNGNWPGDDVNNPIASPANPTLVKHVAIQLRIDIIPYQSPTQIDIRSEVNLRNLKENL